MDILQPTHWSRFHIHPCSSHQWIGGQDAFWIMAPCGTVPGTSEPCQNEAGFGHGWRDFVRPVSISCPGVSVSPTQVLANNNDPLTEDEVIFSFHGEGNSTSDETPVLTLGSNQYQTTAFPIRIKKMKRRIVKVLVQPVLWQAGDKLLVPRKATLERMLNEIFATQINAWFDVTIAQKQTFDYDTNNSGFLGFNDLVNLSGEVAPPFAEDFKLIRTDNGSSPDFRYPFADYDIEIILISQPLRREYNLIDARANTYPEINLCVVSDKEYKYGASFTRSEYEIAHTIAHEIGHVMLGGGHPDDNDGIEPLPGTDRGKRLMCSAKNSYLGSNLLVKKEWDEAEKWLQKYPDKRINQ